MREERTLQNQLREIGATIYANPFEISNFSLIDQNNNEFNNANFLGNWNLLFFGFTSCPDICPITMAELGRFFNEWGQRNSHKPPRIILVTVDPETDSPEKMKEYLEGFSPEFIGLTGNRSSLQRVAEELFVAFDDADILGVESPGHNTHSNFANPSDYVIDHSSHISVINPNGDLFAVMRPPHRARDISIAFRLISQ